MGTVVAVLNQKGGAGKTTLATHLDRPSLDRALASVAHGHRWVPKAAFVVRRQVPRTRISREVRAALAAA